VDRDSAPHAAGEEKAGPPAVTLADFQGLIRKMYLRKDVARGIEGTFMWLLEEIAVVKKYGAGCPGCGQLVCVCPDAGKP
jgi:hypothetical protein